MPKLSEQVAILVYLRRVAQILVVIQAVRVMAVRHVPVAVENLVSEIVV